MNIKNRAILAGLGLLAGLCLCLAAQAPRQMEALGRGVVAVHQGEGRVFVSWRLLGNDPEDLAFNLYRATGGAPAVKLNSTPITKSTCYQDTGVDLTRDNSYFVRPLLNGREGEMSKPFLNKIPANSPPRPYFEVPLQLPPGTRAGDGSVGDLDGDGEYEIVLKGSHRPLDTASSGITGNTILHACKLDGTLLWTIQMGQNIREGEHDTQFMVYDLDGDGLAEIAVRTADGTIDGAGKVIGDPKADWVDRDPNSRTFGKIMSGPEYFTIFHGRTGAELATVPYIPGREPTGGWGGIGGNGGLETTTVGNRMNRFLACVAYLDGSRPSVIMCRGYYGRSVLAAWDWRDGKLTSRWVFDSATHPNQGHPYVTTRATVDPQLGLNQITDQAGSWQGAAPGQWMVWDRQGVKERRQVVSVAGNVLTVDENMTPGTNKAAHVYGYSGMGNHNLSVADVDADGKDEIIYGAMVVDDNGQGLFTTGLRHGDSLHVGDLDPARPGLEVFGPHENEGGEYDRWTPGAALFDARTGKILWATPDGQDVGGGVSGDVDPRYPGEEMWGIPGGLYSCRGEIISPRGPSGGGNSSFVIWWDGDPLREVLAGNRIAKWDWLNSAMTDLLIARECAGGRPILSGDLLGDWREEVILRASDNSALRIFTTTAPADLRLPTLVHNPQYRLSIAWQNVAYNQPPHPGFFLGYGMKSPPQPHITTTQLERSASSGDNSPAAAPVRIIFDTDMHTDCDDAGALAVLHALADNGECDILATVVSVKDYQSAATVDAINTYYGRPDLPLGMVKGPGVLRHSNFTKRIAADFPHSIKSAGDVPEAVDVYRNVLEQQPDGSVTVITVGYLTNLRNLLQLPAEAGRPSGRDLVQRKVVKWVCMGGNFIGSPPKDDLRLGNVNFQQDAAATLETIRQWPRPIVFVGREIGSVPSGLQVGANLAKTPPENPVRLAYFHYFGSRQKSRHVADLTTVLYAVRGLRDYWDISAPGRMNLQPDVKFDWQYLEESNQSFLLKKVRDGRPNDRYIESVLDKLLLQAPRPVSVLTIDTSD